MLICVLSSRNPHQREELRNNPTAEEHVTDSFVVVDVFSFDGSHAVKVLLLDIYACHLCSKVFCLDADGREESIAALHTIVLACDRFKFIR